MLNVKIKNTSKLTQGVPGYAAFAPGETRTFTQEDAKILANNPYLVVVDETGSAETSSKPKSTKKTAQESSEEK